VVFTFHTVVNAITISFYHSGRMVFTTTIYIYTTISSHPMSKQTVCIVAKAVVVCSWAEKDVRGDANCLPPPQNNLRNMNDTRKGIFTVWTPIDYICRMNDM
jgi:hypothetical protein